MVTFHKKPTSAEWGKKGRDEPAQKYSQLYPSKGFRIRFMTSVARKQGKRVVGGEVKTRNP